MTNFFLDELRKIYGDGRVIHDPQFIGECCYGSLGDLRVKARFTKDIVANQYPLHAESARAEPWSQSL